MSSLNTARHRQYMMQPKDHMNSQGFDHHAHETIGIHMVVKHYDEKPYEIILFLRLQHIFFLPFFLFPSILDPALSKPPPFLIAPQVPGCRQTFRKFRGGMSLSAPRANTPGSTKPCAYFHAPMYVQAYENSCVHGPNRTSAPTKPRACTVQRMSKPLFQRRCVTSS